MRVPIENGLGFINQVSDFIKLPAAYWIFFIYFIAKPYRISKLPEAVSSSPQKTR